MSNISTVAPQLKTALYNLTVGLFQGDPTVLVSYGHPGPVSADNVIFWIDVHTQQVPATMSTNRTRDEDLEVSVFISSYMGGVDSDQPVSDKAYGLLGLIENKVRSDPDGTLAGLVLWCFVTATTSKGSTEPSVLANGRQVDLVATFTARARISN